MWNKEFFDFSFHFVGALALFAIGYFISKALVKILHKLFYKKGVDRTTGNFLQNFVFYFLLLITILIAMGQMGLHMASVATILGAIGLSVALGLKDYLTNVTSGLILLLLRPFKIGDEIKVLNERGVVKEIGLFLTKIEKDTSEIYLPNNQVVQSVIIKEKKAKR